MKLLLMLFAAHALCDYPLQGDFLARGKNHRADRGHAFIGIPWWQCLLAHCLIHSGAVLILTRSVWLALAELVIHAATDYAKSDNRISFNQDQAVHYFCKLVWWLIVLHR